MKKNFVVAAGLSSILVFGACACSVSGSSTSSTTVETTDENGNTSTNTKTTTTTTEGGTTTTSSSTTTTTTSHATKVDLNKLKYTYKGKSDKNVDIFYAENDDATRGLIILSSEGGKKVEVISGAEKHPEDSVIEIADDGGDVSFKFMVTNLSEDKKTAEINCGDEYGKASVTLSTQDEFINAVKAVDPNGEVVTF